MWKWIVQECSLFWLFGFIDPGGGWVSFWYDFWVRGVRLSSAFPRIAASAQSLDLALFSCVDLVGRVAYDFPLRYQLRGGALEEWRQFQAYLANLPVPVVSSGPARVVWPLHPSACFSVRSCMAEIRRRAFPGEDGFPYLCIWKKEAPSKVQGFMWLAVDGESIDHIFLACSFSRKVWSRFSAALSISGPVHHIFSEVVMGWKGMHCMTDFTSDMGVLLHAFCWFIWLERNDRVFREVVRTDAQVAHRISAAVGSWLVAAELFSKEQLLCWTRCCSFQREPD
ncbi:hypothetical protein LINGRAHAP2_LOCUS35210 [Linum grandiflorum]